MASVERVLAAEKGPAGVILTMNPMITKFHSALPGIKEWIVSTVEAYKALATPVIASNFLRLRNHFPEEFLEKARVVVVPNVPYPPLSRLGLPEFAQLEKMRFSGITFLDTFFVDASQVSESLYFHELIHLVQWNRLGMDKFLLAYGIGLLQFGYRESPLERMAYGMQSQFENQCVPSDLIATINQQTDAIWNSVLPLIEI